MEESEKQAWPEGAGGDRVATSLVEPLTEASIPTWIPNFLGVTQTKMAASFFIFPRASPPQLEPGSPLSAPPGTCCGCTWACWYSSSKVLSA